MLKKLILIFLFICLISIPIQEIKAEEITMDSWNYKMVTTYSDNDPEVYISRFTNSDNSNLIAFCLEPTVHYNTGKKYQKVLNNNERIFKLVKAYQNYFKSKETKNEYYIATQILIWLEVGSVSYTFKGNDYSTYKDEINTYVNNMSDATSVISTNPISTMDCIIGEEYSYAIDTSKYNFSGDGIDIDTSLTDKITFIVNEELPTNKKLYITPKYNPKDYSFTYESSESQNLYIFEGDYEMPNTEYISINTIKKEFIDINYSKKDIDNNIIEGTKFALYEISNDINNNKIFFININKEINLYELLNINKDEYENLKIEVSPRYEKYLNGDVILTGEIGYFECTILNNDSIIKKEIIYVSDDIEQTNDNYNFKYIKEVYSGYSENKDINTIKDIKNDNKYYLCEIEPKKGYEYVHNACKLVDTSTYNGETIEFINKERKFNLKLMKHNREDILLDGAQFKLTYYEDDIEHSNIYITGSLNIKREDNKKYLIYKYQDDNDVKIVEFVDDYYLIDDNRTGVYYYYQSDIDAIDESLLTNKISLIKGGFIIEDLPYMSTLILQEIQAPLGYEIDKTIYNLNSDIPYSEIVFTNYRVNEFIILPKQKYISPQTCVEG